MAGALGYAEFTAIPQGGTVTGGTVEGEAGEGGAGGTVNGGTVNNDGTITGEGGEAEAAGVVRIAPNADVPFPRDGAAGGASGITRSGDAAFTLAEPGDYLVLFRVNVLEAGQLTLTMNGAPLPETTAGRAMGGTAIDGAAILHSTTPGSVLTLRNPGANGLALTLSPTAGGTQPTPARLVILRLA